MEQQNIQNEIKWLEEQLEAKKKALSERGEAKEEREALRDIIKDVTSQNLLPAPPAGAISDDDSEAEALRLGEKEHGEIINDLVAIAFSKGIFRALKTAESFKNPHILDEFHDILADRYYRKLLESRKIK